MSSSNSELQEVAPARIVIDTVYDLNPVGEDGSVYCWCSKPVYPRIAHTAEREGQEFVKCEIDKCSFYYWVKELPKPRTGPNVITRTVTIGSSAPPDHPSQSWQSRPMSIAQTKTLSSVAMAAMHSSISRIPSERIPTPSRTVERNHKQDSNSFTEPTTPESDMHNQDEHEGICPNHSPQYLKEVLAENVPPEVKIQQLEARVAALEAELRLARNKQ